MIALAEQFTVERLHGVHMPHQVHNGGVANDAIPLTQLGAMFWAWNVGRASVQFGLLLEN